MAETFSNANMESLLTRLIEHVKDLPNYADSPKSGARLDMLITDLEDVTSELKSCKSDWKTATQQAEERAKQLAENHQQLEEREKTMKKEEEQLKRRTLELLEKEKMFEESRAELEKKEELLQQQSVDLEQAERNSKDEQARLQAEAAIIESDKSEVLQAEISLKARTDAAEQAEKANTRRSNGFRQREAHLKLTFESTAALNETVKNNLAAVREELEENKKVLAAILEKHGRMKKLRTNLVNISASCATRYNQIQASRQDLVNSVDGDHETLAGLKDQMTSLSTALTKQAEDVRGVSEEIAVAEKDLERLVTSTERQLGGVSTNIGNVTEASAGLEGISSKIGNFTQVSTGLDEVSEKFQQFQPTMIDTLRELTEALSKAQADATKAQADAAKAQADAAKAQADSRRTLVNYSVSRFEESMAKRGLGPTSPEKPISKRRRHARQSSVGSAEMLTNVERLERLPENILDTVRSPRGQGRVARFQSPRGENDSSSPARRPIVTARTPSGAHGLLRSSSGLQSTLHSQPSSSMNPATATGEHSSQGAMISSSQSGVSATVTPALSEASDEVKRVWRQIDFPANWDTEASNLLLQGLNKNIGKKVQAKYRPAGLLDGSSARPNCVLRRLQKVKSPADNGDENRCSECQKTETPCVRASFVSEDLADVEYDPHGQRKRWKLTIREG